MSVKINDATPNRPEGYRLVDAPAVQVNFNEFVQQIKKEKAWQTNDRNAITVFKTPGVTVVITALHKGAAINDLKVDDLLILQVMEGSVQVTNDGNQAVLRDKQMLVLNDAPGSEITATEETVVQLTYIKTITAAEGSVI